MPRKPKQPQELTTDEAMRRLFGRKGLAEAKRAANPPEKGTARTPKRKVKSTKGQF